MAFPGRGFQGERLELLPTDGGQSNISELRLIVSGLCIGVTLSLWQERLLDESRGRVFRPIRARKHHESKKKERRDRRRASATPKPPALYKMKDFYLPGYQPPDFPGKMGSSPPREFDSTAAEEDRASEGSPDHQDMAWHMAKDAQSSKEPAESPFRASRDKTKRFMDDFVAEARAIWTRTWHSLQEESSSEDESSSGIENVFLSLTLEKCLEGGLRALGAIFQGQALTSLDDVYLVMFVSATLSGVSRIYRLTGESTFPSDSDMKMWRSCIGHHEWVDFCKTLGLLYGSAGLRTGSDYETTQVPQKPLKDVLESTTMYSILVSSLRGTQSLGEAFRCLSCRSDAAREAATSTTTNPAFQDFLDRRRKAFAETIKTAISEDFSGKLLFLEALSSPAVGLLASGTLPTLRAFEDYVLGLARIYIPDFGDFKSFVRRFLRFCEGCSAKVPEIFVKNPQNEDCYSREYSTQKIEAEVNWYKINVVRSIAGGLRSSIHSSTDFDQSADQGDTSRPKYSSQFKRDYSDVGNLLALPDLLWTENGNIKLEVDSEVNDQSSSPVNPTATVAATVDAVGPHLLDPEVKDFSIQPCFQPQEPPAVEADDGDDEDDEDSIESVDTLVAVLTDDPSSRGDAASKFVNSLKQDITMESVTSTQEPVPTDDNLPSPKPTAKRKSWRTDSIVSVDLLTKKRKGLPTVCDICGMTLSLNPAGTSKSNLIRHNATHAKNILFSCTFPGCEKSFGRKDNLTRHMRKVHDSSSSNTSVNL